MDTPAMRHVAAVATIVAALALAGGAAGASAVVPKGDILAVDATFHPLVLDAHGHVVRRLPSWHVPDGFGLLGIELAPSRNDAFVSLWSGNSTLPARIFDVSLATGARRLVADGLSPSLSPDGTQLAYLADRREPNLGLTWLTGLVVRTLATGKERTIPFDTAVSLGTPPALVTNWSPNGVSVALAASDFDLVDTATATSIADIPSLGATPSAPAFLDADTVIVETNCCIGRQKLVAVDPHGAHAQPFAEISSPVDAIRRIDPDRMLVLDQLGELLLVSRGKTTVIANGIRAAAR